MPPKIKKKMYFRLKFGNCVLFFFQNQVTMIPYKKNKTEVVFFFCGGGLSGIRTDLIHRFSGIYILKNCQQNFYGFENLMSVGRCGQKFQNHNFFVSFFIFALKIPTFFSMIVRWFKNSSVFWKFEKYFLSW